MAEAKISDAHNSQTPSLIWLKFGIWKYLMVLISNIKSDVTLKISFQGNIWNNNFRKS